MPQVPERAKQAHVIVPFMAHVDRALLEAARSVRLIIQFGVGVEGVDIPAVGLIIFSKPLILPCNSQYAPPELWRIALLALRHCTKS